MEQVRTQEQFFADWQRWVMRTSMTEGPGTMATYQFWAHITSGEVWAVRIDDDRVTGACGPLHYEDRDPSALPDYDYDSAEGADLEEDRERFRLYEEAGA